MTEILKRAGVIGWPVEHSKSPRLHTHWLQQYGIHGSYTHLPIPPDAFSTEVRKLAIDGWQGANVTLPHKEAALALADETTARARTIGAANTLIFRPDGSILADNTDGFGFIENLKAGAGSRWDMTRPAVVLGAGGASRAIIFALLDAGVPEIRLANRTRQRAETLGTLFGPKVRVVEMDTIEDAFPGVGLIVNTTSLGMKGQPPLTLDLKTSDPDAVATDIVYTPLITPFLENGLGHGLAIVDGLGMLLHQARPGFAAWFGKEPEVTDTIRQMMLAP